PASQVTVTAAPPLSGTVPAPVTCLTSAIGAEPALSAATAAGTLPMVGRFRSAPVSDPSLTFVVSIASGAILLPSTAWDLIFGVLTAFAASLAAFTAFALICFVPTLFAGSAMAAYDAADNATNSARNETTFANVTLLLIMSPPSGRPNGLIRKVGAALARTDGP